MQKFNLDVQSCGFIEVNNGLIANLRALEAEHKRVQDVIAALDENGDTQVVYYYEGMVDLLHNLESQMITIHEFLLEINHKIDSIAEDITKASGVEETLRLLNYEYTKTQEFLELLRD